MNEKETRPTETRQDDSASVRKRLEEQYGADVINDRIREKTRMKQVILRPDQYDDDVVIDALEKSVAYNRDRRTAEDIQSLKATAPESAPVRPTTESQRRDDDSVIATF